MTRDPYAVNLAHELLDAYGTPHDGKRYSLEAELDAITGNRTTALLLDVARERRDAPRPPFTLPRDPGLMLARKLADPGSFTPAQHAGALTPLRGARTLPTLGDLALVVAVTLPLVWLGVWWSTKGGAA
jgi:hypothetical protein